MDIRKLIAVGAGVSLEVSGQDLVATVVRVRPGGIRVLDQAVFKRFLERPAAEWGAEYQAFLQRLGLAHLAATFLLPRREVIVRQLALPGIAPRDLEAAITLQLDGLHPYGDDEVVTAWSCLPGTPVVLVGIARKSLVEDYAQVFLEAGVKVAAFSFSAAALYTGARILTSPPAGGFVAAGGNGETELYGESQARPIFSAVVEMNPERAVALALSELRLPPETEPRPLAGILAQPVQAPEGFDLSRSAAGYAAALVSACPWLGIRPNLLPPQYRASGSRVFLVPTLALALLLVALVVAAAAQPELARRRQLAVLEAEIVKLEPQAQRVDALRKRIQKEQEQILLLDAFRNRTREDMDALNALTRVLAPPAWVNTLEITREAVVISGEIDQASPLLKALDETPYFRNSEFIGPVGRSGNKETFRIRALREGVAP
ncbi:MAG: hypothetical protein ACUVXB_11540 [Bryobacteraceae bacterium]